MAKYSEFGQLLTRLRHAAGLAQQVDLAQKIGSTQQTVSRWELGLSRPRSKQLPTIAGALGCEPGSLALSAGYVPAPSSAVATYSQPFPLGALTDEAFERFCFYVLAQLYPQARVHRIGGRGHTQEGADIEVYFTKETLSFQCKHHAEFGPGKVRAAVRAHIRPAKKKIILLSRVATPRARKEIRRHKNWELWDVEDLSRRIRNSLSLQEQRRLVDTFFRGQRLALIGETEAGPWQTVDEFFEPYDNPFAAFSHRWPLIGREQPLASILDALSSDGVCVAIIVGRGGGGKTRVLKETLELHRTRHPREIIFLLSTGGEITSKSLDELGTAPKLLVVDDAHDRQDLTLLFAYAAAASNQARLLLTSRLYGIDSLRAQAAPLSLSGGRIREIRLEPLSVEDATKLAEHVLRTCHGNVALAEPIARSTYDCPLTTVIGAFLVAKNGVHPDLVNNERAFRDSLLGRFREVLSGSIGRPADAAAIHKLLNLIALLQPVYLEDEDFKRILKLLEGVEPTDTARLLRVLAEGGVLIKRSGRYRLSPDVLADFLIEESCLGIDYASTGYAERVLDHIEPRHLQSLLLNLGRLDWRLANGQPSTSALMDQVWPRLKVTRQHDDPCLKAVRAVAFFQPKRALDFVEQSVRMGIRSDDLAAIVRNAAYNLSQLRRAAEILWILGRADTRQLGQVPNHPIRVLTEICAVQRDKPVDYNEVVVEFMLERTADDASWNGAYTPLDVLSGALQTEGHGTDTVGLQVEFTPFVVRRPVMGLLRVRILDRIIDLFDHPRADVAVKAAHTLGSALVGPTGQFGTSVPADIKADWNEEFRITLCRIASVIAGKKLRHIVLIEIGRSVAWHMNHGPATTRKAAREVIAGFPKTLEFRTMLALTQTHGRLLGGSTYEETRERVQAELTSLAADLTERHSDPMILLDFIESVWSDIVHAHPSEKGNHPELISRLIGCADGFGQVILEHTASDQQGITAGFAPLALARLLRQNYSEGIRIVAEYLSRGPEALLLLVAQAYGYFKPESLRYTEADISALQACLRARDEWAVRSAIQAVREVGTVDFRLAVDLLHLVDPGESLPVAEDLLIGFQDNGTLKPEWLSEADVARLLERLRKVPALDGYCTQRFLAWASEKHSVITLQFFLQRLDYARHQQGVGFRVCSHGPLIQAPLRFRASGNFERVFSELSQQLSPPIEGHELTCYWVAELFAAICSPFDTDLVDHVEKLVNRSSAAEMVQIAMVLGQAPPNFVFYHRDFVDRFLSKAASYGPQILQDCIGGLVRAAISGVKAGVPGQPFPRDLEMKDAAEAAMKAVPRLAPSYALYEQIHRLAEQQITLVARHREILEG